MQRERPLEFIVTEDGSQTARFGDSETMHSLKGAFNETVYIYGTALDRAAKNLSVDSVETPYVLSLGLGLGYVEILSAAYALKRGLKPQGESFEIVPELIESFRAWLNGANAVTPLVPGEVYDAILERTAGQTGLAASAIKSSLQEAVTTERWLLRGEMKPTTEFHRRFQCVAFDAFSGKTTPELWSREFLDPFLVKACDANCVLSTYACTGHLKRALRDAGFTLEIREGYASKRDSTLAIRQKIAL